MQRETDKMSEWEFYNHAVIPVCAPDEDADISVIENGSIWGKYPNAVFARWTSNFNCEHETEWWYIIKNDIFDIEKIKAKRRYEIKKGIKNFEIKQIFPHSFLEELYMITNEAYKVYPEKYRRSINKENFIKELIADEENGKIFLGAFLKEDGKLCGYSKLEKRGKCIKFSVQKILPQYEKYGLNAALVFGLLDFFKEDLKKECYICDGEKNIQHETEFQKYLNKYFEFKKAYCKLNIKYNPKYKLIVKVLYLIKKPLKLLDGIKIIHKINGVLIMEEIVRKQKKADAKNE